MLDDDFIRVDDGREINRLIPLNEMAEIAHELLRMGFVDSQSKFRYRINNECAQFKLMFHVEQLNESVEEVKTFRDQK